MLKQHVIECYPPNLELKLSKQQVIESYPPPINLEIKLSKKKSDGYPSYLELKMNNNKSMKVMGEQIQIV